MLLIDYEYYTKTYKGTSIPESSFEKKAVEASDKVNYYTFNRINEDILNDNIKFVTCQIAEILFEQEELKKNIKTSSVENGDIASETLGPHSISYVNKSNLQSNLILDDEELENEIYTLLYQKLVHTGIMNRRLDYYE